MKKYILIPAFLFSACIQDDINKGVAECKRYADEATENAWDECTNYFETEVIPFVKDALTKEFTKIYLSLAESFDQALDKFEETFMIDLGCFKDTVTLTWDCSESTLCHI